MQWLNTISEIFSFFFFFFNKGPNYSINMPLTAGRNTVAHSLQRPGVATGQLPSGISPTTTTGQSDYVDVCYPG